MRRALLLPLAVLLACGDTTGVGGRTFSVLDDEGSGRWAAVSAGADDTCGLDRDGVAYCWGLNLRGQLGVSSTDSLCTTTSGGAQCTALPAAVETSARFLSISAGARHTCAIA